MKITKEYIYNQSTTPTPIYLASLNSNSLLSPYPSLFAYGSTHAQAISNLLGLILLANLLSTKSKSIPCN